MSNIPEARKIVIPIAYQPLLQEKWRFKVYYGGRGAGKSYNFALCLLLLASLGKIKVLCAREFQASIKDSVHALLKEVIETFHLPNFEITETEIRNTKTKSTFIFKGIKRDIASIKSLQGITHCWVEEAATVSKSSWDSLIPTIRAEESEIWISFNTILETNETYHRFVKNKTDDTFVSKVLYYDNPYISKTLLAEKDKCKETRPIEDFNHIWLGDPIKMSDAVVFKGFYEIRDFITPSVDELYQSRFFFGADWGFANDPNCLIRCFIKDNCLWIDYESFDRDYIYEDGDYKLKGTPATLQQLGSLFDKIPQSRDWSIIADSARPETINFVKSEGFNIESVKKTTKKDKGENKSTGKGYVEDGIEYIKGTFDKVIIHERCVNLAIEFLKYSYKIDSTTEEVLPVLAGGFDHGIDALRYALSKYMRKRNGYIGVF